MDGLEQQKLAKQQELAALKRINALTDQMRTELDEMSIEVSKINKNAESVANVMANWDSIRKYISEASLGLLRYAEGDYQVGAWDGKENKSDKSNADKSYQSDDEHKTEPLPEALVRISVANNEESRK